MLLVFVLIIDVYSHTDDVCFGELVVDDLLKATIEIYILVRSN